MNEQAKLSDLTVSEFRALMQECFDADRKAVQDRKNAEWAEMQRQMHGLQVHRYQLPPSGSIFDASPQAISFLGL